MINTILTAISGLFTKDFLFASALPAIIVLVWICAVAVGVLGVEYSFGLFDSLSLSQKTSITTLAAIAIVITAYLLSALRSSLIRAWSGENRVLQTLLVGPARLLQWYHQRRCELLESRMEELSFWKAAKKEFQTAALSNQDRSTRMPDFLVLHWIRFRVAFGLRENMSEASARSLLAAVARSYRHVEESKLWPINRAILRKIDKLDEIVSYRSRAAHVERDREFGSVANIRATRLGNVIQAYNHYGFKRYQLETEVFWPRLIAVIPEAFAVKVREPKIILDFAVTTATASLGLAFIAAVVGPWFWYFPKLWASLGAFHVVLAVFFYFLGVKAAIQYGDMIRSCFDLYRLDLLEQLQFSRPRGLFEERARWEHVSRLLAYGQASADLKIPPATQDG